MTLLLSISPGWEFKKARAKPLITGLPPSSPVLFLFALWAHAMLCSLLFKSTVLLHAALYLYITVCPSCVTAPIRVHRFSMEWQPEPVDASEESSFCFGTEMCHFLLYWVQWATQTAVAVVTQDMSVREIRDLFWSYIMIIRILKYYLCEAMLSRHGLLASC